MPKLQKVAVLVVVSGIAVIIGYVMWFSKQDTSTTPSANKVPSVTEPTTQSATAGQYVAYSTEAVGNTKGDRILFFHAPWCPQCRELDASIQSGAIPQNVTIFKVDYDSNQKLRQQYGVTIQTTVVLLDADGNEAKKYVPYSDPALSKVIENLL